MTPPIEYVCETGSTNADLLSRLRAGEALDEGHWLVADRQTAGRGRQGRAWLDGPGNFMGSTVVRLSDRDPPASSLSFVAALAVYETVLPGLADPFALMLKWPNDVLLEGAKFCGLLLEAERGHVVIGIGVNLAAAPQVTDRAVRALSQSGPAPSRDAFAQALARQFATELQRWRDYGSETILRRWKAAAHPPGTRLRVHDADGQPVQGTYDGLGDDGALRLRLADGTTHIMHAGDVMLEDK
ncbi:biotin--[acetyl-CoA-carboxylase] ligase [Aurantiacibacter poecillastricola]|uniref:biotin--[acetyl-CoA-carboxylase] ligase n=1 Tax=Aurantiacibacter poecillastricola TaxID=3064385 RepID=UPI00273E8D7E|nr:biotin--[acetyl-CoA-carboxylase] ligase [Aurantiacibacter sp. 219JJ12-13]MDP5262114.1 biotin--[acetyl-CoA-carboxylase] ligase [Aurantiacibacter sp. 219JJ12-13]